MYNTKCIRILIRYQLCREGRIFLSFFKGKVGKTYWNVFTLFCAIFENRQNYNLDLVPLVLLDM